MTIIEFRMFFDSLPDKFESLKGQLPTKKAFALECNIPLAYLKEMTIGQRTFTEATVSKLLPVMRRYGFQG